MLPIRAGRVIQILRVLFLELGMFSESATLLYTWYVHKLIPRSLDA